MRSRRALLFAAIVALCVLGGGASVLAAKLGRGGDAPPPGAADVRVAQTGPVDAPTEVLFRRLDPDRPAIDGRVALVRADGRGPVRTTAMRCRRVHWAGGHGICVTEDASGATFGAELFDRRFHVTGKVSLEGQPSRARMSPDGRYAAVTMFVGGHSYAQPGTFSTAATIIDVARGKSLGDLERFTVTRDGERVDAPDVNFWGVTFAQDSNTFYATLSTGGHTYLIRGDVRARTARTLHENVECPALSPDGTRIAYKKLIGKPAGWRLHVLDLRTMRETAIADPRPVDDQVEWLDDDHLLYEASQQVWEASADGSGAPRRFVAQGESPAVVRGGGPAR